MMLELMALLLARLRSGFVRLDGTVPQNQWQQLVSRFPDEPACRAFLAGCAVPGTVLLQ